MLERIVFLFSAWKKGICELKCEPLQISEKEIIVKNQRLFFKNFLDFRNPNFLIENLRSLNLTK